MSEYYTHLLVAKSNDYTPDAPRVQEFLSTVLVRGVVPLPAEIVVRTPSKRTRAGINPFTREKVIFPMKDTVALAEAAEISEAILHLKDYDVEVSGVGRPTLLPLPIKFEEPYYVAVRCRVSSTIKSTTDDKPIAFPFLGVSYPENTTMGLFTDPGGGPVIEIPEAGCARFWIEVELGKNLFPELHSRDLDILNPEIVALAERVFCTGFVQAYNWG